jgi:exodeoxyribonuclease VII large subunit
MHAAFLALQQKLAARGWFAQERKRPLPVLPRTIGIVTSLSGAALYDMLKIIQARRPGQHVIVAPSLVQGESAPASIARAIRLLVDHAAPDVIIVGRGGGSLEDLWCWNEEEVVRAVVECPVPVVSGVGHEVDVSLCDLAADVRAATPTHAAELVVPDVVEIARRVTVLRARATRAVHHQRVVLRHRLDHAAHRLRVEAVPTALLGRHLDELRERVQTNAQRFILLRRHRLELLRQRVQAQAPHHRLRQWQQRLATSALRLRHVGALLLERRRQRLLAVEGRLQDVSPLAVLERGYAIVSNAEGKAVRAAQETAIGELLDVRLHEGRLKTRVEEN